VFHSVCRLDRVYGPAYKAMFNAPSAATVGLAMVYSKAVPAAPAATPTAVASVGVTSPLGNGRCLVRFIAASRLVSKIWLNAPALAAHRPVPTHVAAITATSTGAPPARNPAPDVTTTNELNRALVRSAYSASLDRGFLVPLVADAAALSARHHRNCCAVAAGRIMARVKRVAGNIRVFT